MSSHQFVPWMMPRGGAQPADVDRVGPRCAAIAMGLRAHILETSSADRWYTRRRMRPEGAPHSAAWRSRRRLSRCDR